MNHNGFVYTEDTNENLEWLLENDLKPELTRLESNTKIAEYAAQFVDSCQRRTVFIDYVTYRGSHVGIRPV